jgi:hypothetical protein
LRACQRWPYALFDQSIGENDFHAPTRRLNPGPVTRFLNAVSQMFSFDLNLEGK